MLEFWRLFDDYHKFAQFVYVQSVYSHELFCPGPCQRKEFQSFPHRCKSYAFSSSESYSTYRVESHLSLMPDQKLYYSHATMAEVFVPLIYSQSRCHIWKTFPLLYLILATFICDFNHGWELELKLSFFGLLGHLFIEILAEQRCGCGCNKLRFVDRQGMSLWRCQSLLKN